MTWTQSNKNFFNCGFPIAPCPLGSYLNKNKAKRSCSTFCRFQFLLFHKQKENWKATYPKALIRHLVLNLFQLQRVPKIKCPRMLYLQLAFLKEQRGGGLEKKRKFPFFAFFFFFEPQQQAIPPFLFVQSKKKGLQKILSQDFTSVMPSWDSVINFKITSRKRNICFSFVWRFYFNKKKTYLV